MLYRGNNSINAVSSSQYWWFILHWRKIIYWSKEVIYKLECG
jgi:hypothetical protein